MKVVISLLASLVSVSVSVSANELYSGLSKDCGKLNVVSLGNYRQYRLELNANNSLVLSKFKSVELEQAAINLDKQNVCVIGKRVSTDMYYPVISIEPQR